MPFARPASLLLLFLAVACGRSDEDQLRDAANQSDPAAAEVLNGAAENGMDPQAALNAAGEAQLSSNADQPQQSLQARPNSASDPNPPRDGQPPEKVASNQH